MAKRSTRRSHHTDADAERYGFRWGNVDVSRNLEYRGRKSLSVITDYLELEVGVSPQGRRIQVWLDHTELVDPEPLLAEIADLRAQLGKARQ